jgi:hypothetical protein
VAEEVHGGGVSKGGVVVENSQVNVHELQVDKSGGARQKSESPARTSRQVKVKKVPHSVMAENSEFLAGT